MELDRVESSDWIKTVKDPSVEWDREGSGELYLLTVKDPLTERDREGSGLI